LVLVALLIVSPSVTRSPSASPGSI
jgi:hypothetical protein